jgi:hypothetical protein
MASVCIGYLSSLPFFGDGRHQKSSHVFFLPLVVMYCTVYSIKALYDCCYMFLYIGSG